MNFKPGDLVVVVKPITCCGDDRAIGKIYTVTQTAKSLLGGGTVSVGSGPSMCSKCGYTRHASDPVGLDGTYQCERNRLRKIDPLTEQDKTETLQEITA